MDKGGIERFSQVLARKKVTMKKQSLQNAIRFKKSAVIGIDLQSMVSCFPPTGDPVFSGFVVGIDFYGQASLGNHYIRMNTIGIMDWRCMLSKTPPTKVPIKYGRVERKAESIFPYRNPMTQSILSLQIVRDQLKMSPAMTSSSAFYLVRFLSYPIINKQADGQEQQHMDKSPHYFKDQKAEHPTYYQ